MLACQVFLLIEAADLTLRNRALADDYPKA